VIPLRDDNPTELFPLFTLLIMAACVFVWFFVEGAGGSGPILVDAICTYGAIPVEVLGRVPTGTVIDLGGGAACMTGGIETSALLTSMFLHGGWMHLIGNLWFLWIFGNNIEDSMGRGRFLVFYLLTGLIAAGAHVVTDPGSAVPMVGASGAISGIMGAYLVLYPRARVHTLIILVIFFRVIPLPAWVMLGYWFLLQLASSVLTAGGGGGGVAFGAHIGGFLAGVLLIRVFARPQLVGAKRASVQVPHPPGNGLW